MTSCCAVVIGHVDHGKTALVRALTGIETDQLPEEKTRGLSITPGFAHCTYLSGTVDLVDAPGHADFIQNMVAGATGARAALIVISLVEGVEAQTLEHLTIASLLGISDGVIALTKSDMVTTNEQAAQMARIRAELSQTAFRVAPMVVCSALTGEGIDRLHSALEHLLGQARTDASELQSFLPIDRAFTLPGRGTIVTGTLLGQPLGVDTPVVLHPMAHKVTIRSLQSRGTERLEIQPGERMAANLRGVAANDIPRGTALCATGGGAPSVCIDAYLDVLPSAKQAIKHMRQVRVLFGTTSAVAQVRRLERGGSAAGYVQLRFQKPVVGYAGQRAILRRLSPPETIGGAIFLDPNAQPTRSGDGTRMEILQAAHQRDSVALANALSAAGEGVAKRADIARLARLAPTQVDGEISAHFQHLTAELLCPNQTTKDAQAAVINALETYHLHHPLRAMAPRVTLKDLPFAHALLQHVEETLVTQGQLRREESRIALEGHDPIALLDPNQRAGMAEIEAAYRKAGLAPPPDTPEQETLTQLLIDTGVLVSLHNVALKQVLTFHRDTLSVAHNTLATTFPAPQAFTTSQARATLETSRRVIVPLLEHFDKIGVTIRAGDARNFAVSNSVSPAVHPC